ncbi:Hypothetical protein (Fragment) [Durusdinium trenchii]|uniref:Uncharacterized protein n=1 Tax=Durusdinium trenchii TaxID=1381693 RepID=A0ABP0RFN4_9DINO
MAFATAAVRLAALAASVHGDDLNFEPVQVTSHCHKGQWCPLPENFLSASEACEFAVLRVNEMRQKCHGFTLAPIRRQDYKVAGTVRKDMDGYSVYKLLLEPINKFVPTSVEIEVAHLHRITDLSIFQGRAASACAAMAEFSDFNATHANKEAMDKMAKALETITKRDLRFGSSERKLNVAELPASDTHMTVITPKLLEKAWKKETGEDPSKSVKFTLKGVGNPFALMDCTRLAAPAGTLRTAAVDELKAHFFGSPAALPDTLQLEMIARSKEEACGKKPLIRFSEDEPWLAFLEAIAESIGRGEEAEWLRFILSVPMTVIVNADLSDLDLEKQRVVKSEEIQKARGLLM